MIDTRKISVTKKESLQWTMKKGKKGIFLSLYMSAKKSSTTTTATRLTKKAKRRAKTTTASNTAANNNYSGPNGPRPQCN
jgi:hypothetical protein